MPPQSLTRSPPSTDTFPKQGKGKSKTTGGLGQCQALIRPNSNRQCQRTAEMGSKWCQFHEGEQGKWLRIYKAHSRAFDAFLPSKICRVAEEIQACNDTASLKTWHDGAMEQWMLANRAIEARAHHHSLFYRGGDNGHQEWIGHLRGEQAELEHVMELVDKRSYELILTSEKASWVMEEPDDGAVLACHEDSPDEAIVIGSEVDLRRARAASVTGSETETEFDSSSSCASECGDSASSKTSSLSSSPDSERRSSVSSTSSSSPDSSKLEVEPHIQSPREVRRAELVRKLTAYLYHADLLVSHPAKAEQRSRIVQSLFRLVISRNPSLLVRAQPFDDIATFLSTGDLKLEALEKLWRGLKMRGGNVKKGAVLTPEVIRNAIKDAEREPGSIRDEPGNGVGVSVEQDDHLWVLGGRVWKKASAGEMSREQYDHYYDFIGCSGCAMAAMTSYTAFVENRRLAIVGPRYPHWAESSDTEPEKIFRALGIALCGWNRAAETKLERIKPKGKGMRVVMVEKEERCWVFLRFLESDPDTSRIFDELSNTTCCFTTLSRLQGSSTELTHRPSKGRNLWTSRIRSGFSTAERRAARWTDHSSFRTDVSALESLGAHAPEARLGKRYRDCAEVLVMDERGRKGDKGFESFIREIAEIGLKVKGLKDLEEACMAPAEVQGKIMEMHTDEADLARRSARWMFREPL